MKMLGWEDFGAVTWDDNMVCACLKVSRLVAFSMFGASAWQRQWQHDSALPFLSIQFSASRDNENPECWPDVSNADIVITSHAHFRSEAARFAGCRGNCRCRR